MNECCKKWKHTDGSVIVLHKDIKPQDVIIADFCPECGTRLKGPVDCSACKFAQWLASDIICTHPSRLEVKTEYSGGLCLGYSDLGRKLNANNDCGWFERKEG